MMLARLAIIAALLSPSAAIALTERVIDHHILPGFSTLANATSVLRQVAEQDCRRDSTALRDAYGIAFDGWIAISHLRFGPTETNDRAYALAFWPDRKGTVGRALLRLIAARDESIEDPADFATVSVAARGFFALEQLLYDERFADPQSADYRCRLVQAIATDIAGNAEAMVREWETKQAPEMRSPGPLKTYRTDAETRSVLFNALAGGLQATSELRLGRPLGTFDRPRPRRAEAYRSGRSLAHIVVSLEATRELSLLLAEGHPDLVKAIDDAFERSLRRARRLDDPVLAGVAEPATRFRIEALRDSIDAVRRLIGQQLAAALGVTQGFNALDGD